MILFFIFLFDYLKPRVLDVSIGLSTTKMRIDDKKKIHRQRHFESHAEIFVYQHAPVRSIKFDS